jgi:gas vesicle protein
MGMFTHGLMVGVGVGLLGVGAGLLVAPLRGEEMRHLVSESVATLRASLPGSGQRAPYILQVSASPSQAATQVQPGEAHSRLLHNRQRLKENIPVRV